VEIELLRSLFEPFEWFRSIVSAIIATILSTALSWKIWSKIIKPPAPFIKKILVVIAGILIFVGIASIGLIIIPPFMSKVAYFENFEKGLGRFKESYFAKITDHAINGKYSLKIQSENSSFGYYGTRSNSEELFRRNYNYLVSFKYKVVERAYFTKPDAPEQKLSHFYLDVHREPTQENSYYQPVGGGIQWNGLPGSEGTAKVSFTADVHDLCLGFGVIGKGTTLIDDVKVVEIEK